MTHPDPSPDRSSRQELPSSEIVWGMALAGALVAYGVRRRGIVGTATGVAGAGLFASLVAPHLSPRLNRPPRAGRPIDVEESFVIERPAADVFAFFRNFEHFTLLGGLLHSVEDFDDGRSRWRIAAPDGRLLEWDVIVTKYVPGRVIAWESIGSGPVESRGTVRFHAVGESATRVDVMVHYLPLTDAATRAFRPFAARPRQRMRAGIGRIGPAMQQAEQPGFYDREPSHPLPALPNSD